MLVSKTLDIPCYDDFESHKATKGHGDVVLSLEHTASWARAGLWQEVEIPLSRFLLTHKGRLVEERQIINQHRILSLGISLAGQETPGPFALGLEWVKVRRQEGGNM